MRCGVVGPPPNPTIHTIKEQMDFIYTETRSQGALWARLLAEGPSGLLTLSFAPIERSGRVTHAEQLDNFGNFWPISANFSHFCQFGLFWSILATFG